MNILPNQDINYFMQRNVKFEDIVNVLEWNNIWVECLLHWCSANYNPTISGKEAILDQNILWNSEIKINKKTVFYQKMSAIPKKWKISLNKPQTQTADSDTEDNHFLIDQLANPRGLAGKCTKNFSHQSRLKNNGKLRLASSCIWQFC